MMRAQSSLEQTAARQDAEDEAVEDPSRLELRAWLTPEDGGRRFIVKDSDGRNWLRLRGLAEKTGVSYKQLLQSAIAASFAFAYTGVASSFLPMMTSKLCLFS